MIISRTPFRISFFGGGTDYPAWYRENGGSVLATTIDKYCYISCRYLPPFFEHKHRIVYSHIEMVKNIDEIRHPSIKAVLNYMGMEKGLEIHHDGDLPARSGLGSSSAFTVGLLNALRALRGEMIAKDELASTAIHIEQNLIREAVGSQDQISAAFGGFNKIDFMPDDTFNVVPVIMTKEKREQLQGSLMLFFTGLSRTAASIAIKKIENFKNRKTELTEIKAMADEAFNILQSNTSSIDSLGKLLHNSWKLKRTLSDDVSNQEIDEIYQAGIDAGASGGKILGAGGGGFILFFVKPEFQDQVHKRLKRLLHVSFNFDNSGSKIVLYDPKISK